MVFVGGEAGELPPHWIWGNGKGEGRERGKGRVDMDNQRPKVKNVSTMAQLNSETHTLKISYFPVFHNLSVYVLATENLTKME